MLRDAKTPSDARRARFGLWYDFRNPPAWRRPPEELYRRTLDQVAWADTLGFDSVWVTEHHFCEDGYTPSPLVALAAMSARTSRIRLGTNLMIPALHHPVRLAEDAATLSILSGGRFDTLGVGAGYRALEFEGFGRKLVNRPSMLEESVAIIRRAWTGQPVAFEGKRYTVPAVRVEPTPERPPRIFVGALTAPARARAARIGDGYLAPDNTAFQPYLDALEALGEDPRRGRIAAGQWAIVSDDPEQTWARIGAHAVYMLNAYVDWGAFGNLDPPPRRFASPAAAIAAGAFQLWDASRAVAKLTALFTRCPQLEDVHFWAQLPGEDVDSGSSRIEYLATKVLPVVRRRLEAADRPAASR